MSNDESVVADGEGVSDDLTHADLNRSAGSECEINADEVNRGGAGERDAISTRRNGDGL